jgi:TM2 domain-containing membrane protein YozV
MAPVQPLTPAAPIDPNTTTGQEPGSFQTMVARTVYQEDPRLRSATLATLLSLMPGLGQVYLGYIQQGFINALVVASIIALLASDAGALTPLLALFMAFFWLYNIVDANRRAILLNQRVLGLAPGELPEDISPALQGSVFGGLVLIVGGVLALAHVRFGLSMAWVERWWPMALIGLGIYLVWKAVKQSRN